MLNLYWQIASYIAAITLGFTLKEDIEWYYKVGVAATLSVLWLPILIIVIILLLFIWVSDEISFYRGKNPYLFRRNKLSGKS